MPVAIFVVGSLIAVFISKGKSQREAIGAAFATLLVIWLLYILVAVVPGQPGAAPFFGVASFIFPLAVYFILMHFALRREAAQADLATHGGVLPLDEVFEMPLEYLEASQSMRDVQPQKRFSFRDKKADVLEPAPADDLPFDEPSDSGFAFRKMLSKPDYPDDRLEMDQADMRKQPPSEQIPYDLDFRSEESLDERKDSLAADETVLFEQLSSSLPEEKIITAPIKKVVIEPAMVEEEESIGEVLFDTTRGVVPDVTRSVMPDAARSVVPDAAKSVVPEPTRRAIPEYTKRVVPEPKRRPASDIAQPVVPKPAVEPKPVVVTPELVIAAPEPVIAAPVQPEPVSASVSYASCCEKAAAMASRGLWPMSAVLYEESSVLTDSPEERIRSTFDAMTSYTKANKMGDVRRLVELMIQEPDLSPTHKIKLQAISKMLK
ncbi:MAG: hypothetical protein FWE41_08980 [Coriobacteriia bacterium]|nr:hypothetical protein [Coriobacteriia bacterium]